MKMWPEATTAEDMPSEVARALIDHAETIEGATYCPHPTPQPSKEETCNKQRNLLDNFGRSQREAECADLRFLELFLCE